MKLDKISSRFGTLNRLELGDLSRGAKLVLMASMPVSDPLKLIQIVGNAFGDQEFFWARENIFLPEEDSKEFRYLSAAFRLGELVAGVTLIYSRKISVYKAIAIVEDVEGDILSAALVSALFAGDRALNSYESGNIPKSFIALAPFASAASLSVHPSNNTPPPLPEPLTDEQLIKAVKDVPFGYFDGTIFRLEKAQYTTVLEQMFPQYATARTSDFVRWVFTFSKYLWSPEWWSSSRMQAFARSKNSALASVIESLASYEAMFRRPIHDFKGYRIILGAPDLDTFLNADEVMVNKYLFSIIRAWLQLVELYSHDCPVEALRSMLPKDAYIYNDLKIDVRFELNDQSMLRELANSLLDDADQNAVYAPYGIFSVTLPDEIAKKISDIDIIPNEEEPDKPLEVWAVDFIGLMVYATPEELWVRLIGEAGPGPIVYWRPRQLPMDNLMSESFGILLNTILAALWRDLRVAGPTSFFSTTQKRKAETTQTHSTQAETRSTRKKRSGRGITASSHPKTRSARVLPSGRWELKHKYYWSNDEEKAVIRRRLHGVRGFPRRLPENWKPSEAALQLAQSMGVVLPKGTTFVKPHVRGKQSASGQEETALEATPVNSKGLATIMAFLETKRKE